MQRDNQARYDRQVRLWQLRGQKLLELAHVCVINGNSAGAEMLKNLVLPGIGEFTIIDDAIVTSTDLSGNFFLHNSDIRSSLASALCRNLCELNSDVRGNAVTKNLSELLQDREFWYQFDVVVITGFVPLNVATLLGNLLWPQNIPLLKIWTSGFYAALRVARHETTVVETHDPSLIFDLRLDSPWSQLTAYCNSFDLDLMDDTEHAHVPYIVIYLKALAHWRRAEGKTDEELPLTHSERTTFSRDYVQSMARNMALETNFIEATQSVHRCLQRTQIPTAINTLMLRQETSDSYLRESQSFFWLYVRALSEFVSRKDAKLPLPGNLPDMVSTTSNYVLLQKIFQSKAVSDKEKFTRIVETLYAKYGMEASVALDQEAITNFCKNSAHLYVTNGSQLNSTALLLEELLKHPEKVHDTSVLLIIYFALLARDKWAEDRRVSLHELVLIYGEMTKTPEECIPLETKNILEEIYLHGTEGYLNICSYIGGIAAQEILKIVTCQYIPLDNLFVFDGIKSVSEKWKAE